MKKRTRHTARGDFPDTVEKLIDCGARRFRRAHLAFGHGLPSAWDEAAYLTLHALGLHADELPARLATRPARKDARKALRLFERRIGTRAPAAYLTGVAWLAGLRFHVNRNVIVPRSYIAELLQEDLAPWIVKSRNVRSALDLCTGSGCLAIMLARSFPHARIDASDLSRKALAVARRNVAEYGLEERIALARSDLYEAVAGRRYDLIVSNPPYVAAPAMRRLPPEYRHEPPLALAGGRDGLDFIRNILTGAPDHLTARGLLVVETGHSRARVERAFPRTAFFWPETSGGDDCVLVISREALVDSLRPAARARAGAP